MLNLKPGSLNWALKHAQSFGDTDIFPPAFEIDAIAEDWARLRPILERVDVTKWPTRPYRRCLSPKGRLGFRVATQLDPLDFLLYAATIYKIGAEIERTRVPVHESTVFSYRFRPKSDGTLFNPDIGYASFIAEAQRQCDAPWVSHVAITDIADFYAKIYHHPLENALALAAPSKPHVAALRNFLSSWSNRVSHGIPIGNAPSRLLAELALADVDQALLAAQINFVRYNDDYRIFAESYEEAYRHLAFLANVLYENHGLTLQPKKTRILEEPTFRERYLRSPRELELHSLRDRFRRLLSDLGLESPYEEIEYSDLSKAERKLVDRLNLVEMFTTEVEQQEEPDEMVLRFILRRMAQLNRPDLVDICLDNITKLHPVLPDIIRYLSRLTRLTAKRRGEIGRRLLSLLEDSVVSELEYHRLWILHLFASSKTWNCADKFIPLLSKISDPFSRRKLILALGRASAQSWFTAQRRSLFDEGPWAKRAFLLGASCLPRDARDHWYKSIESRLDDLERSVVAWARHHPFP